MESRGVSASEAALERDCIAVSRRIPAGDLEQIRIGKPAHALLGQGQLLLGLRPSRISLHVPHAAPTRSRNTRRYARPIRDRLSPISRDRRAYRRATTTYDSLRHIVRQHLGNVMVAQRAVPAPPTIPDRSGAASLRTLSLAKINFGFRLVLFRFFFICRSILRAVRRCKHKSQSEDCTGLCIV